MLPDPMSLTSQTHTAPFLHSNQYARAGLTENFGSMRKNWSAVMFPLRVLLAGGSDDDELRAYPERIGGKEQQIASSFNRLSLRARRTLVH